MDAGAGLSPSEFLPVRVKEPLRPRRRWRLHHSCFRSVRQLPQPPSSRPAAKAPGKAESPGVGPRCRDRNPEAPRKGYSPSMPRGPVGHLRARVPQGPQFPAFARRGAESASRNPGSRVHFWRTSDASVLCVRPSTRSRAGRRLCVGRAKSQPRRS